MKRIVGHCPICKVDFTEEDLGDGIWYNYDGPEKYDYRGFTSCGDCFDDLIDKVDGKRERIMDDFNSRSMESQRAVLMPKYNAAGIENPFYEANNDLTKRAQEIASKPNWEEENEYRQGKL